MQDKAIKPQALARRHRVTNDIRSVIKSLGLVFGDIGTSPIYTLTVIFLLLKPTVDNVMGVLSLIVWTLVILVSVEYAWLAMSLGEKGEGGTIILRGQLIRLLKKGRGAVFVTILTFVGISLLVGDGVITPAISILSAVEGILLIPGFHGTKQTTLILIAATFVLRVLGAWAIGWDKPAFWGRDALLAQKEAGPARRMYALKVTGRGVLRADLTVRSDGRDVGVTSSGTFSPTLKTGIALAFIELDAGLKKGDEVVVDVRGRDMDAPIVDAPARLRQDRAARFDADELGEAVVDAGAGGIGVGVRREQGHPTTDEGVDDPALRGVRRDGGHPPHEQRMVHDQHLRAEPHGLVGDRLRAVEGEGHLAYLVGRVAADQADGVPALGERGRVGGVEDGTDVTDGSHGPQV